MSDASNRLRRLRFERAGRRARRASRVIVLLSIALGAAASASAGPREINQACATGPDGCFTGDPPGFPVLITEPGAYVLTGDLTVTDLDTNGIEISGALPFVSLDLRGHTIQGPSVCIGSTGSWVCDNGLGNGITSGAPDPELFLQIANGRVTGFGNGGINVSSTARVKNVVADRNMGRGVFVLAGSILSDSVVSNNDGTGTFVSQSLGYGLTADGNSSRGLTTLEGTLERSVASRTGSTGVDMNGSALIREVVSRDNTMDGLQGESNTAIYYGSFTDNTSVGIRFALNTGATVRHTVLRANNTGLILGTPATYRANTLSNNASADLSVSSTPTNLGDNVCSGALCP